jgi:hypothetical protein
MFIAWYFSVTPFFLLLLPTFNLGLNIFAHKFLEMSKASSLSSERTQPQEDDDVNDVEPFSTLYSALNEILITDDIYLCGMLCKMLLIQKRVPNVLITSNIALKPLAAFVAMAASIQVVQNIAQNDVPVKERRKLPRNIKIILTVFKIYVSVILHQ